jgi:hypothetical protein
VDDKAQSLSPVGECEMGTVTQISLQYDETWATSGLSPHIEVFKERNRPYKSIQMRVKALFNFSSLSQFID